eukprot:scaffold5922_cov160-Amphora_coffeaeformis.AAC.4
MTLTNSTNTSTSSPSPRPHRPPIGPEDIVSVQGRYLVVHGDERFLMQGMAFPIAPVSNYKNVDNYDEQGWIAVLEQLAYDTDVNTVRVYEMDCRHTYKYDGFLQRAAEMGIYVIIPLTTRAGDGVLNRNRPAPHCYNQTLYDYGRTCMDLMARHPNIVAGLIGNEVMNSLETWPAAPCIQAYARDLRFYTTAAATTASTTTTTTNYSTAWVRTSYPLMYASQHDSPTAAVLANDAMKMTEQYLACRNDDDKHGQDDGPYVDIFGINVESWCSSLQTFDYEEDGTTESVYHQLYETLRETATMPTVFSEMGCAQNVFNRDNGLPQVRDWHQVPAVLEDMVDTWSGFCVYTYDGNVLFRMMNGTWNGHDVLAPTTDYDNFRHALQQYHQDHPAPLRVNRTAMMMMMSSTSMDRPSCAAVREQIHNHWKVQLYPLERMPSYYQWESHRMLRVVAAAGVVCLLVLMGVYYCYPNPFKNENNKKILEKSAATETDSLLSNKA